MPRKLRSDGVVVTCIALFSFHFPCVGVTESWCVVLQEPSWRVSGGNQEYCCCRCLLRISSSWFFFSPAQHKVSPVQPSLSLRRLGVCASIFVLFVLQLFHLHIHHYRRRIHHYHRHQAIIFNFYVSFHCIMPKISFRFSLVINIFFSNNDVSYQAITKITKASLKTPITSTISRKNHLKHSTVTFTNIGSHLIPE